MISFEAIRHPKYKYRLTHAYNHALENFQADDRCALRQDDLTWIQLYQGGLFHVARGYCWDGASGPALDTMNFARASLVHDAIYQLIAAGLLPKKPWKLHADRELYRIAREDGMPWWRASWVYGAVRVFGDCSTPYYGE